MRLLIIEGLTCAYDLDHSTTPEVVRISKVSNIVAFVVSQGLRTGSDYRGLWHHIKVRSNTYGGQAAGLAPKYWLGWSVISHHPDRKDRLLEEPSFRVTSMTDFAFSHSANCLQLTQRPLLQQLC